jgi:hypothetical protein
VSSIGVDNEPEPLDTIDTASVLASQDETSEAPAVGETAASDIEVLPEQILAEAPAAETESDFAELLGSEPIGAEDLLTAESYGKPESVIDIAEVAPESEDALASTDTAEPKGPLASMTEAPSIDLGSFDQPAVVSDAPVAGDLLKTGLAAEEPVGGLNAVAQVSPEQKMANAQGLKVTDFTKPMVATVGNLLKQTLTQKKAPVRRAPAPRPVGGLQAASAKPAPRKPTPPPRMDVANLIPVQKAVPTQKAAPVARVAPPKTLASGAKLTPITDIASLTSLVKKGG